MKICNLYETVSNQSSYNRIRFKMARKPYKTEEELRNKIVTIRLNNEEKRKLDRFCQMYGKTHSQLIRLHLLRIMDAYAVR